MCQISDLLHTFRALEGKLPNSEVPVQQAWIQSAYGTDSIADHQPDEIQAGCSGIRCFGCAQLQPHSTAIRPFALDNYHCHRHGVSVTDDSYRFTEAEGIAPEAFCEAIGGLVCTGDITVSEASVVEPSPSAALDSNVLTEEEQTLLDFLIAYFHGMDENNLCGSVEAFSHCLATNRDGLIALNAPIDLEAPGKDPIFGS